VVIPQTPRHDFLHELHKLLRPATYLEIGVQTGRSLAQAIPPTFAIGVDPEPRVSVPIPVAHQIFPITSDRFFEELSASPGAKLGLTPVDLAFIDGMHLVEYALRDFIGVERHARPDGRTVAVFDDVLPYRADIAGRTPLPGDWTGDVWKILQVFGLAKPPGGYRPDLTLILVDVAPTGALVVLGLDPASTVLADRYDELTMVYAHEFGNGVTGAAVHNAHAWAVSPAEALDLIRRHLNITEA
jgi:hypothetical protein